MAEPKKFAAELFPRVTFDADLEHLSPERHALAQPQRLKIGIARTMNSSNNGTVKAMSPCAGL